MACPPAAGPARAHGDAAARGGQGTCPQALPSTPPGGESMQRQRRRHSNPTVASARNPFDGRCAISASPKAAAFIVALTSNKAKRVQSWLAGLRALHHNSAAASRKVPLCLLGPSILWHEPFMEDHIFFSKFWQPLFGMHTCTTAH